MVRSSSQRTVPNSHIQILLGGFVSLPPLSPEPDPSVLMELFICIGVSDPENPFNDDARPNSWTPPLNTSWDYSNDLIYGVNLGGLFVLEPFITPALFQKYPGTADEYTLSQAMRADNSSGSGGIQQIEEHYKTFIVGQILYLYSSG